MFNKELIKYIKEQQDKGIPEDVLKQNLINNGWDQNDYQEAKDALAGKDSPLKPTKSFGENFVISFIALLALDVLIIVLNLFMSRNFGIFGFSLNSILIRLLVITILALIFSYNSRKIVHKKDESMFKLMLINLGQLIITLLIGIGVFFVGCLAFVALR